MSEDPEKGLPAYDEPLDSDLIDKDPDFRETLRLLNEAGVHTVSSCQGHAPGTQYEDVQEWMAPYITCRASSPPEVERACEYLREAGEGQWAELKVRDGKVLARFPLGWRWSRSVAWLKSKILWRRT